MSETITKLIDKLTLASARNSTDVLIMLSLTEISMLQSMTESVLTPTNIDGDLYSMQSNQVKYLLRLLTNIVE